MLRKTMEVTFKDGTRVMLTAWRVQDCRLPPGDGALPVLTLNSGEKAELKSPSFDDFQTQYNQLTDSVTAVP